MMDRSTENFFLSILSSQIYANEYEEEAEIKTLLGACEMCIKIRLNLFGMRTPTTRSK